MTAETNAENKITALELREQELQTVIQQLSVDLQNVSLSQVRFDSKSSMSAEVRLDISYVVLEICFKVSNFSKCLGSSGCFWL